MTLRHIPALAVRATVCAGSLAAASASWADSPSQAKLCAQGLQLQHTQVRVRVERWEIRFSNLPDRGTMSVSESLAMHAKERQRIIAECNASPACQAEVQRRSARGRTLYSCSRGYYLGGMSDNPYATCFPN
jgi:hypothetical protein